MKRKKLRWSGSQAAMREHEEALQAHPPKYKRKKGKRDKKSRQAPQPQPTWREQYGSYAAYLLSPWWKAKREDKLKAVGRRCERCRSEERLQVHHKHYRTIGREKNTDLEVLCRSCHAREHECLVQADSHLRAINRPPA